MANSSIKLPCQNSAPVNELWKNEVLETLEHYLSGIFWHTGKLGVSLLCLISVTQFSKTKNYPNPSLISKLILFHLECSWTEQYWVCPRIGILSLYVDCNVIYNIQKSSPRLMKITQCTAIEIIIVLTYSVEWKRENNLLTKVSNSALVLRLHLATNFTAPLMVTNKNFRVIYTSLRCEASSKALISISTLYHTCYTDEIRQYSNTNDR